VFALLLAFLSAIPGTLAAQGESAGGVEVTPDGGVSLPQNPNTGYSATFAVLNDGSFQYTFNLTCGRTGAVASCESSLEQITLAAGASGNVPVEYTTGSPGTGTVTLTASRVGASDQGSVNVTVMPEGKPGLVLKNHNRDNLDRSLCLTVGGAGEAAAVNCGQLLVTHSTPGYATMGRTRALTLLYNSGQAMPGGVVAATVTQRAYIQNPSSLYLEIKIGGVIQDSATYNTSGWGGTGSNQPRQAVLWFADTTRATGIYPFVYTARNKYNGGSIQDSVLNDTLIVVNRHPSQYGAGWSLVGVERLILNQPAGTQGILWVGGDGSARWYRKVPNVSKWVAPLGAFRDTLVLDSVYTRTLRHGIQVVFDALGRHIRTVNRVGQVSTFVYSGTTDRVTRIYVPPDTFQKYTLKYDANNKLDRITDPAGRILDATVTSNRVTALVDPDTSVATSFSYAEGSSYPTLLTGRTTRRGFKVRFRYQGNRITLDSVPHDTTLQTGFAVTGIAPWDGKGWNTKSGVQTAVDTSQAFTAITGPRIGVSDDATFWVDRWGAPVRMVGALSDTTFIRRANASVPALPTQVIAPDKRTDSLAYDGLGNLVSQRTTYLNDPTPRITRWTYADTAHTRFSPDSIIDEAAGLITRFTYNTWGLDSLAIAPDGHVTQFLYVTSGPLTGLPSSVRDSLVPVYWPSSDSSRTNQTLVRRFGYNSQGNVVVDTSAMGRVDSLFRDSYQRVIQRRDPEGHLTVYTYNPANRVRTYRTGAGPDTATTSLTWRFDHLTQVTDGRGVYRKYSHDPLGRVIKETDDYGLEETRTYDLGGNLTSRLLRTGRTVTWLYDAANRDTLLAWEATGATPADTIRYLYDIAGRLLEARDRLQDTVVRTYYPTGLIKTDVSKGPRQVSLGFGYDLAGRRTMLRVGTPGNPAQRDSVWYTYGAAGGLLSRIDVLWRNSSQTTYVLFDWDPLGRRDRVTYSNGAVVRFTHDGDGKLRLICGDGPDPGGAGTGQFDVRHHVDSVNPDGLTIRTNRLTANGCPTGRAWPASGDSIAYDSRHQILYRNNTSKEILSYDRSGNRLLYWRNSFATADSTRDSMPPLHNRIFTSRKLASGNFRKYYYNSDGGLRMDVPCDPACDSTKAYTRKYYYDGMGRPVVHSEKVLGTWVWNECFHDALGRQLTTCEGQRHQLGYEGHNVVRTGSDNQTTVWTFIHGPGIDDPILSHRESGNHTYFWITDGSGRRVAVGKADGNPADLTIGGANATGATQADTTFDPKRLATPDAPGVSFFRNRWYTAETGRWLQEDPIGVAGGVNLYQYVGNNPVAFTDPFGLCPPPPGTFDPLCFAVNLSAGFGDAVTFGLTAKLRGDADAQVDKSSSVYTAGQVTGVAASAALGGAVAKTIEGGGVLATSAPARAVGGLVVRAGEHLLGTGGSLNTGEALRIGLGKLGGGTGRAVLRVAGSAVKAVAGVEHVNLVDLGRLVKWF
jgi:RHS repeat-associated protein